MLCGMNGLTLTSAEIIALKQAHRACKDKRAADRIKAVYSLGVGFSVEDVVDILMLDEETLRNYVKRYQSGGIKALIADHYQGSVSKLSAIQLNELNAHLEQNTYLTVEAIIAHVYEQYDVSYTVSGMTDLIHRLKFTYKKSKLVPAKADKKKQEQFLTQLEALKASKGKDNIVKSNTGRQRVNINGTLDSETHAVITREDESINAISTIELLKKVEAAYPLAVIIYVICDNARYYRSKLVGQFLETSKIQFVFLPSYSPNLNLIERLWKFMKKKVLYNKYYEKFDTFKEVTLKFFENIQQYKPELDSLLTSNFRLLNAD